VVLKTIAVPLVSLFPHLNAKFGSTAIIIDLKADVHRKNSSASSESIEIKQDEDGCIHFAPPLRSKDLKPKLVKGHSEPPFSVSGKETKRLHRDADSLEKDADLILEQESFPLDSTHMEKTLRHSVFTNNSLDYLPRAPNAMMTEMKPTSSVELGYFDKNQDHALNFEGLYLRPKNADVRRFKSTALETCCAPPAIPANTNSLEVIGCKTNKNPLPPPSTCLTRNQHLNLCRYYGKFIYTNVVL